MSASALPVTVLHSWAVVPIASGPRSSRMTTAHASAASSSSGNTACSQAARRVKSYAGIVQISESLLSERPAGCVQSPETAGAAQ